MEKVKLINHDCLINSMLLSIMFAYLMLFAALSNAVCIMLIFFSSTIEFYKKKLFSCFVLPC